MVPQGFSASYTRSYALLDRPDGSIQYMLNVVVSQSLYDYYREASHRQVSVEDFAKFVTPYALRPIADRLREIYGGDDEKFANGALMLVHQIPYNVTLPIKYPVETIVENKGDCDLFSYIAASIIKAGGVDVVLLLYEDKAHMNIGVNLPQNPQYARTPVSYVTVDGVKYYIAECTAGTEDWRESWRVGECPLELRQERPQVISLENCEQVAPGQVSASYKTLASSTISLNVSPFFVIQGSTVTLSGQISPNLQNKTVTIYVRVGGYSWNILGTTTTDASGSFTYLWRVNEASIYQIRASWSGDDDYAGADSQTISLTAFSTFFIVLLAGAVILVFVGIVIFLMSTQKNYGVEEPQPPQILS
ncbi:Ig-like domain repeat protein [Candidatus Bathyarchaeota archaeon]|nr:Ig-like domain repeat protein [Candidatus Bathyarchaeota archaeon]